MGPNMAVTRWPYGYVWLRRTEVDWLGPQSFGPSGPITVCQKMDPIPDFKYIYIIRERYDRRGKTHVGPLNLTHDGKICPSAAHVHILNFVMFFFILLK